MKYFIVLLFVLSFSCTKKEYDVQTCTELSQTSYKGSPQALNEFNKNCKHLSIKYTHELCQNALNDLVISGNYPLILEKYGPGVEGCFTANDIKKFSLPAKE
jgi:hypothetical protein